ncbi:MAG: hypothetical protein P4L45_07435, partial [Ignavibacteriaceae bacterium]|nr:hypothetical protein [Ignavibacteriaceae bacterium]
MWSKGNRVIIYLTTIVIFCISFNLSGKDKNDKDEKVIDKKVKLLLSKMTLEEKIGQMTQICLQAVSKTQGTTTQKQETDLVKLKE